jgi:hypothetical protein
MYVKFKTVSVTGRGVLQGREMFIIPRCLGNRLIDGGEVVSLKRRPLFTPEISSGTHLCYRLSKFQSPSEAGRKKWVEKFNEHTGTIPRDLTSCNVTPQQNRLPHAPYDV